MNEYKNVMLISPNKLKSFGDVNLNLDDSKISAAIRISQNIYLTDVFGKDIICHLQELVYGKITGSSGNTIDDFPQYKDLLDEYIVPTLAYRTVAELAVINTLKQRNMGTVKNSDVNVNPVSTDEYKYLQNYYMTFFYDYVNKTWEFLCENKKAFVELPDDFCTCSSKPLFANTSLFLG